MKNIALIGLFALASASAFAQSAASNDLSSVKTYLLDRLGVQKSGTSGFRAASDRYYDLARAVNFDYAKLAQNASAVRKALQDARAGWVKASPVYESVEGIVAGVELLSEYDLNLDAGAAKTDGGESIVTFDLKLPDGRILQRPGNAFGLGEGALWGTERAFSSLVRFDVDGDGKIGFGDQLPDAKVLKASAAVLDDLTGQLVNTAKTWKPTLENVFGALTANVPTVAPVFVERWKTSRFVLGDSSTRRDFNVISSLNDLEQNVASWQSLYKSVSGNVRAKNASLDSQIQDGLSSLKAWVVKLQTQERARRFSPEQAELILKEGDNRATAITGKIAQAAALVGVKVGN